MEFRENLEMKVNAIVKENSGAWLGRQIGLGRYQITQRLKTYRFWTEEIEIINGLYAEYLKSRKNQVKNK